MGHDLESCRVSQRTQRTWFRLALSQSYSPKKCWPEKSTGKVPLSLPDRYAVADQYQSLAVSGNTEVWMSGLVSRDVSSSVRSSETSSASIGDE